MSTPQEQLVVDGLTVTVVRRKGMKTMRLRVKDDGAIVVSCSRSVSLRAIKFFVHERVGWILGKQEQVARSPLAQAAHASDGEKRAWREWVEARVPSLVRTWEAAMGVRAGKLAYREMTSRWGSCNIQTGRICINTRLALFPPQCLEYVVVHELAHLLEPKHNAHFKAIMTRYLPDWRERDVMLKR